jgi:hypothetical protein
MSTQSHEGDNNKIAQRRYQQNRTKAMSTKLHEGDIRTEGDTAKQKCTKASPYDNNKE